MASTESGGHCTCITRKPGREIGLTSYFAAHSIRYTFFTQQLILFLMITRSLPVLGLGAYLVIVLASSLAVCGVTTSQSFTVCVQQADTWRLAVLWPATLLLSLFSQPLLSLLILIVVVVVGLFLRFLTQLNHSGSKV